MPAIAAARAIGTYEAQSVCHVGQLLAREFSRWVTTPD